MTPGASQAGQNGADELQIPSAGRLPLQCGIALTQGSQAFFCAKSIRVIKDIQNVLDAKDIKDIKSTKYTKIKWFIRVVKRRGEWLGWALPSTVIALGLATVLLLNIKPNGAVSDDRGSIFADPLILSMQRQGGRSVLATTVTFLTECIILGFLISTYWTLRALSREAKSSGRVTWVQAMSVVLWLGRVMWGLA